MKTDFKFIYPSSEKVYLSGKIYPELKVGMRKVHLTPTHQCTYMIPVEPIVIQTLRST